MEDRERTEKWEVDSHNSTGSRLAVLLVLEGEAPGRSISLSKTPTTLGRGAQADIVLQDKAASRQHAQITSELGLDDREDY